MFDKNTPKSQNVKLTKIICGIKVETELVLQLIGFNPKDSEN